MGLLDGMVAMVMGACRARGWRPRSTMLSVMALHTGRRAATLLRMKETS
jgi:hypothetical protein